MSSAACQSPEQPTIDYSNADMSYYPALAVKTFSVTRSLHPDGDPHGRSGRYSKLILPGSKEAFNNTRFIVTVGQSSCPLGCLFDYLLNTVALPRAHRSSISAPSEQSLACIKPHRAAFSAASCSLTQTNQVNVSFFLTKLFSLIRRTLVDLNQDQPTLHANHSDQHSRLVREKLVGHK